MPGTCTDSINIVNIVLHTYINHVILKYLKHIEEYLYDFEVGKYFLVTKLKKIISIKKKRHFHYMI